MRGFFAGVEVGDGDVSSLACFATAAAAAAAVSVVFPVSAGFSIVAFAFSCDQAFVEEFQAVGIGAHKGRSGNWSRFIPARIATGVHLLRLGTTLVSQRWRALAAPSRLFSSTQLAGRQ